LVWASGGGGSFSLDPIGTAPNDDGATYSSGVFNLEPADATHGGVVAAANQDFGDFNRKFWGIEFRGDIFGIFPGIKFGGNSALGVSADALQIYGASFAIVDNVAYTDRIKFSTSTPDVLDLTGLGTPGKIKLKSPDGTTYTVSIADGGTWNIT
jgi:hypothetical protein